MEFSGKAGIEITNGAAASGAGAGAYRKGNQMKCTQCLGTGFYRGQVCSCITHPHIDPRPGEDLFTFLERVGGRQRQKGVNSAEGRYDKSA